MFVRTASDRDLTAVCAILVDTWHDTYDAIYGPAKVSEISDTWHSLAALRQRLVQPNSEFLVADDGAAIAGMAFASTVDDGKTVMLHQLYVSPDRQSVGIGGLLLDEIESCFPDASTLRLEVGEKNERAIRFYEGAGFARVAQRADSVLPDAMLIVLERPILWAD